MGELLCKNGRSHFPQEEAVIEFRCQPKEEKIGFRFLFRIFTKTHSKYFAFCASVEKVTKTPSG